MPTAAAMEPEVFSEQEGNGFVSRALKLSRWWPCQGRLFVRLVLPVTAISLVLMGVGIVAGWRVQRLQERASRLVTSRVASMRAAEELEITIREIRTQLNLFLLTGDPAHVASAAELRPAADQWFDSAQRLAAGKERKLMVRARQYYAQFATGFERLRLEKDPASQKKLADHLTGHVLTQQVLEPAHTYLDVIEEEVAQSSHLNDRAADHLATGLILLGSCGAGSGLLAGFVLARGIQRSITQLSVPIRDAAGKLNEVVGPIVLSGSSFEEVQGVLHRIASEVHAVVDRLQRSQQESLRSEQLAAVGQLAAGLAHELRNPLMAIKVLVQSAADADDAVLAGRDLLILEEEISRLEGLLGVFLDFARPPRLMPQLIDLTQTLQQTVRLTTGQAKARGIGIVCETPPEKETVCADEAGLRQVLLNLILNALDAMGTRGTVEIRTRPDPAAPDWLEIEVRDSGHGLPSHLGERIFEPFISTKDHGMGLGLSLCRRIMEAHGGSIRAANHYSGGAVFTLRLPRFAPAASLVPEHAGVPCQHS